MNEKINRRRLIQGAGAVAASAALINAPRFNRLASAKQDQVTLTWWDYYNVPNGPAVQAQLDSYTSVNPM